MKSVIKCLAFNFIHSSHVDDSHDIYHLNIKLGHGDRGTKIDGRNIYISMLLHSLNTFVREIIKDALIYRPIFCIGW